MDKINKFLSKLSKKERGIFSEIFLDIYNLNIQSYDIKALKGLKGFYRLRKGKIRIVFEKKDNKGILFDMDFRKDIY